MATASSQEMQDEVDRKGLRGAPPDLFKFRAKSCRRMQLRLKGPETAGIADCRCQSGTTQIRSQRSLDDGKLDPS
ncbi:MAG: hypothetical protein R3F54_16450 [Alphaproteobacteria bacterium]